ncbi:MULTISPECIES: chromosome segregation protein SMC [Helcococcus]|uniref:Chromosome partition protein Smc n=1 Tax=Helcococcus bovis TaxID=3153252 RepID=A0ABW9F5K7_9FIRM
MKLKYVELYGFKSFADKTKLLFNKDISAVVGPNGSGKSNIADAIKWVLGEQSAKSLRGTSMQDVIFSGTDIKKQMNMAQVSLILDNSDKSLPIAFDEVNVTRRVYRTGDSEYLLNKSLVRLKDIRELFLDTGIGKDGYSMIGQGRIDEILNGKNEERRYIFEEATGISKNKYKKSEAEKKLLKNEENLAQLSSELKVKKQQFDILEKQSQNAKEGIKLTNRLELLELNLLDKAIQKNSDDLQNDKSKLEYINLELDSSNSKLNKLVELISPIQEKIDIKTTQLEEKKENQILSDKKIQSLDSQINILKEKNKFLNNDKERLENSIKLKNEKIINFKELILEKEKQNIELNSRKDSTNNLVIHINNSISEKRERFNKLKSEFNILTMSIDKNKEYLSDLKINKNTKEKLDDSNKQLKENYISEVDKINILINEKSSKIYEIENNIKSIQEKINKNTDVIEDFNDKKSNLLENLEKINIDISNKKNNYLKLESQKDILERQYKSYDGYYRSVQDLLKIADKNTDISSKIVGVLADLIEVEEKYKVALDLALGSSLQNIVIKNEEDGKYLINFLKENNIGRITFLPINKISASKYNVKHPKIIDTFNNLVKNDKKIDGIIDYFLAKTILVENIEDAVEVSKSIKGYRVITLDGEIINSWGSMVGGNTFKKESNSLLNRKKELDDLILKLNDLAEKIRKINDLSNSHIAKISELDSSIIEFKNANNSHKENLSELNKNIHELNVEILFNNKRKDEFSELLNKIENELRDEDFSEIDHLSVNLEEEEERFNVLSSEIEALNSYISEEEKKLVLRKSELDVLIRDISLLENDIENFKTDLEDNIKTLSIDENSLKTTINEIENSSNEIKKLIKNKSEFEEKLSVSNTDINLIEEELKQSITKIKEDRKEIDALKDAISEFEKDKYKLELKIENSEQKVNSLRDDYKETYSITDVELDEKLKRVDKIDATRKEVLDIKSKLSKIGYFNYESIEQFNLISEELQFLNKQYDDLIASKNDIINIIKSIEKDMKETFADAFEKIKIRFNEIFSILFNGGEAEIKLDSDDVLNAGIDIIARPPGKKLKNIALLSGGEKALTAVALLFAIFEINPAPFCVLDEIDAALDEANIKRYIGYLKSLVDKTQFIIITHRKVTMEMAEILYGVTMEEKGISKVITLALDDYKE